MLDDYKSGQPVAYKLLKKASNSGASHAYLFQTNGCLNAKEIATSFAKSLICPSSYTESGKCNDCTICYRIGKEAFPELTIIEPDGLWIKKDQLIELQKIFSKKALEGKNKVYIISEAEKLNSAAANSILKFLEEPEENIIAILLTNDIHKMLKTIVSRCQIIILKPNSIEHLIKAYNGKTENTTFLKLGIINNHKAKELDDYLLNDDNISKIEVIIKFLKYYENNGLDVLINTKNLWHDFFKEKNEIQFGFDMMILFYKDVLNYLYQKKLDVFDSYVNDIKDVANKNNGQKVINKLQNIIYMKEKIKYNVNANLLMDKLIINMEGGAIND